MARFRAGSAVALGVSVAMLLAACGGGDTEEPEGGTPSDSGQAEEVALTFWHNSTTGAGREFWDNTVADFEAANPGVTINVQAIQNEDMDGKLQTALNSGDAPDIFMARGRRGRSECVLDRRQGLRHADCGAPGRHLLQPGPLRRGGHLRAAREHRSR